MPYVPQLLILEAIRRITEDSDWQSTWQFFILFSRFEYALKRQPEYLMPRIDEAKPNWDRYASKHSASFQSSLVNELFVAVNYFKTSPPRKQLRCASGMIWSEPLRYDELEPLLIWLLRVIRVVRNNLFHGGKYHEHPILEPSRDHDLMIHAVVILDACLQLDQSVSCSFYEGLGE